METETTTSAINLKDTARQKISAINNILQTNTAYHHGFLGGSLGLLYYYFNAHKVLQSPAILEKAEDLLAQVFEDINESGRGLIGASLSNGAAGFAYTVNYLQKEGLIDFDIAAEFSDMDSFLFNTAVEQLKRDEIDYLHGALGVLFYFTSRDKNDAGAKKYVTALTEAVCNKAMVNQNGLWFKNYSIERLKDPDTADLGLAHGLCGMLMILMNAWPFLDDRQLLEKTIIAGIDFVLSNQIPTDPAEEEFSIFPVSVNTGTNKITSINRLAWCYGDLNVVLLLYRAGQLFLNSEYTEKADEVGIKTQERKSGKNTLCADTHFCHGTAGLAQFYLCLYNESGHFSYYRTYEYWIEKTIALVDNEIANNAYAANVVGILEGWAGVAMVLTEYINEGEAMNWGKAFLL
ncbi:glycoside hydrolase family protein [Ferruginibacter profundus]